MRFFCNFKFDFFLVYCVSIFFVSTTRTFDLLNNQSCTDASDVYSHSKKSPSLLRCQRAAAPLEMYRLSATALPQKRKHELLVHVQT